MPDKADRNRTLPGWRGARRPANAALAALTASAVLLQVLVPPSPAQARQMTRAEYEACQAQDETSFRAAIDTLTQRALRDGIRKIDYSNAVADEWRKSGFDEVLDKRIDAAAEEVTGETSFWDRTRSLVNKDKAVEIATQVAERVYRSDQVKNGLEAITAGVARSVGGTITIAAADATGPALDCLQAFLGPRYGAVVSKAVSEDARKDLVLDPAKGAAGVGTGAVLAEAQGGIAGAVILVVRRQLSNIASRVGQRIVGSILGRLVGLVAGGIGAILIAKDAWELRNGVIPIVAAEMKEKATKDLVRKELASAIGEQIDEHTREIATATADRVIEIWREFRRGHAKVVELAERNGQFRAFVDTLKPADLARLDEVVALVLGAEGDGGVLKRLTDGTLNAAVTRLPPAGMEIARDTRSLDQGLRWAELAGPQLPKVVELGLHRRPAATDITSAQLRRLLALDDRLATINLATVPRSARDTLLELPDRELKALARALGEAELETLASYLTGLEPQARDRVMRTVAATPSRMQVLAPARVRDAILGSRDQLAAVSMMLRTDSGFDVSAIGRDLDLVWGGRISPMLVVDKHPVGLGAAGLGLLMLLLILRRLVQGRPRTA